jgi:hypothetical protein
MKSVSLVEIPVPEPVSPVKAFVSNILGLTPNLNAFWDVIDYYPKDENPQLCLAHYNQDFDPYNRLHWPLRRVRGIVIDLNTGAIVCDSYGHTQSIPCYDPLDEEVSPSNPDGTILVPTEISMYINSVETAPEENAKITIGTRAFDKATTKLFLGYEGAMVRIFKWNGKVFFSTHKRIDASASSWGGRRIFLDLYKELNGPDPESFFGDEPYSPYCYMLFIVHNEIRLATSTSDNRIVFIGMKKVWDNQYEWKEEFPIKIPAGCETTSAFSNNHNHSFIIQSPVDVDTANKFLFPNDFAKDLPENEYKAKDHEIIVEYGIGSSTVNDVYFKRTGSVSNEKLSGGDFIIIYTQTSEGQTVVYRLESPAFEYRVGISGDDPNLYHRFVVEMPSFTKATPDELQDKYPRYFTEDNKEMSLDNPTQRQTYWWSLYYDAMPPHYKDEVNNFYKRYTTDVDRISKFIISEYSQVRLKLNDEKCEERKRVNPQTQKRFDDIYQIATNIRVAGQSPARTARDLLYKETGPSLYRMITTVKNLEKLKVAKPAVK